MRNGIEEEDKLLNLMGDNEMYCEKYLFNFSEYNFESYVIAMYTKKDLSIEG